QIWTESLRKPFFGKSSGLFAIVRIVSYFV
ncbi:unnamed protein product, partial [marine sediment metagenome]